MWKED